MYVCMHVLCKNSFLYKNMLVGKLEFLGLCLNFTKDCIHSECFPFSKQNWTNKSVLQWFTGTIKLTNGWPQQKLPKFGFCNHTTALRPMEQSSILSTKFDYPLARQNFSLSVTAHNNCKTGLCNKNSKSRSVRQNLKVWPFKWKALISRLWYFLKLIFL